MRNLINFCCTDGRPTTFDTDCTTLKDVYKGVPVPEEHEVDKLESSYIEPMMLSKPEKGSRIALRPVSEIDSNYSDPQNSVKPSDLQKKVG